MQFYVKHLGHFISVGFWAVYKLKYYFRNVQTKGTGNFKISIQYLNCQHGYEWYHLFLIARYKLGFCDPK